MYSINWSSYKCPLCEDGRLNELQPFIVTTDWVPQPEPIYECDKCKKRFRLLKKFEVIE